MPTFLQRMEAIPLEVQLATVIFLVFIINFFDRNPDV